MIAHPKENPPTLVGDVVTLRPTVISDADEMMEAITLEAFRYFVEFVPEAQTAPEFYKYVSYIVENPSMLAFTVIENATGRIIGSSCYLDIRPKDDHVEIGFTWFTESVRGTKVNPEAKYLMLKYAFEELGCHKVTLKCDARNVHSANAIRKLGAVPEGQLRDHRLNHLGEWRDTAYFGILASEWAPVKSKLLSRLQ